MGVIQKLFGNGEAKPKVEQKKPAFVCVCGHVIGAHDYVKHSCQEKGCECKQWQLNLKKGACLNCSHSGYEHDIGETCVGDKGECRCEEYAPWTPPTKEKAIRYRILPEWFRESLIKIGLGHSTDSA